MKIPRIFIVLVVLITVINSCQTEKRSSKVYPVKTPNNYWLKDSLLQNILFDKIGIKQLRTISKDKFLDIYRIQLQSAMIDPIYRDIFTIYQNQNKIYLEIKSISMPHNEILNFLNYGKTDSFSIIKDCKIEVDKYDWHELKKLMEKVEYYDLKTNGDVGLDGRIVIIESLEYINTRSYNYHKICRNSPKSYEAAFEIEQFFFNLEQKYNNY